MYPDFSYFFHDLLGTEPDNWTSIFKTFGFMVVLVILVAALMLAKELRRKEKEGLLVPLKTKRLVGQPATPYELILNAVIGFCLGFKFIYILQHFSDFQLDPAAVIFSGLGNWAGGIVGAILFGGVKYLEKNQDKLPEPEMREFTVHPWERVWDIAIVSVIAGVIGAKLFAMIEDIDLVFAGTLTWSEWGASFFSGAGMAIYGGLIVGSLVGYFYVKSIGINPVHVLDSAAPALLVSAGIGRFGCHFAGDGDWGIPVEKISETGEVLWSYQKPGWMNMFPDWLWSYSYPHNILSAGKRMEDCTWRYCYELATPVFPTSIYEIFMLIGLGLFLWSIRKKVKIPGMLFFIYLIFNGLERFFIEKFRINEKYDLLGFQLTQAEIIALVLMLAGIVGCAILWKKGKGGVVTT